MATRKIAVLVGSMRKASFTRRLAKSMMLVAPPTLELEIVEIGDLPMYNEDLETDNPPARWTEFRERIRARERRELVGDPPGRGPGDGLDLLPRDPQRAAGEELGHVEPADLARHVLPREDAVAHHRPHPPGQELPVGGDDRGVRDGQAERMAEQGGDREPVGDAADQAGLGEGAHESPGRMEMVEPHRRDEDRRHAGKHRRRQRPHAARALRRRETAKAGAAEQAHAVS